METPLVTEIKSPYLAAVSEGARRNGAFYALSGMKPIDWRGVPAYQLYVEVRLTEGGPLVLCEQTITKEMTEDQLTASIVGFRAFKQAQSYLTRHLQPAAPDAG